MSKKMISNEAKLKEAKERDKDRRRQELNDLRTVLSSVSGRRLFWRLMEQCKTFETVWEPSARIHYNAGKQDIGHFVMSEIVEADENLLFKMMKEHKKGANSNG